jgi:GNAT superfamily N-acetyltransferase
VEISSVRGAHETEIPAVGALILLSFENLDSDAYLVPPLADRQRVYGDYFAINRRHAPNHGRIDLTPDYQNKGLGSALPRTVQEELAGGRVPQYLEASGGNSARLYLRHGCCEMNPYTIRLPERTRFFEMWRHART